MEFCNFLFSQRMFCTKLQFATNMLLENRFCSALAVDLPAKDPTSAGSTAEVGTPALEQGSTVMDQAQYTAQPRHNTASGSPTDTTVSDNDSSVGDSSTMTSSQPTSAGTHTGTPELIAASSALLAVTRDVSIVYNQVRCHHVTIALFMLVCLVSMRLVHFQSD